MYVPMYNFMLSSCIEDYFSRADESEQQKKILRSYVTDLIVWEDNESKALKEKNFEANERVRDMEKENAYLKEELTGLQKSIAAVSQCTGCYSLMLTS